MREVAEAEGTHPACEPVTNVGWRWAGFEPTNLDYSKYLTRRTREDWRPMNGTSRKRALTQFRSDASHFAHLFSGVSHHAAIVVVHIVAASSIAAAISS